MINAVGKLFSGQTTTMFTNNITFTIHKASKHCPINSSSTSKSQQKPSLDEKIQQFLTTMYPKNKTLHLVFQILSNSNLINEELFFYDFPTLHVADFCSFINNRFSKPENIDNRILKLCKFLQSNKIRFPKMCIKNPLALTMLT